MNSIKVPVLKKDAVINAQLDYNTTGALVQTLFYIVDLWGKEKSEEFINKLKNKEDLTDTSMVIYYYIDRLFRQVMETATKENLVEYTETNLNPFQGQINS
jgi:hypothetical protein